MNSVEEVIARLNQSGRPVFWQGGVDEKAIVQTEGLLGLKLPASFASFLRLCGGGGIVGAEISGIEDADPSIDNHGTVLGDTMRAREAYGLPSNLVVIFQSDEVCWCLDASSVGCDGESPVVSYSVFARRVDSKIAPNFTAFLREYADLRLGQA